MDSDSTKASSGFANVNGTRLFYEIIGSGSPLVLIHGFSTDRRLWDAQIEAFSKNYQVIRYDLRGFGKSALPTTESYSHHEDLKALIGYLGIEQASYLGQSLGGAIALNFALSYPELTKSIIALAPGGMGGFEWPVELRRELDQVWSVAESDGIEAVKEAWMGVAWFESAHKFPEVAASLKKILSDYSGWHFVNDNPNRDLDPPANERLEEISVPTLVVIGELDLPSYNHPIADALHQRIPNAQKVVMPGVGHNANLEDPANFNKIVTSYLANLTNAT
jgi:pimeloyl-ACP methyl ester carboxylesterase